MTQDNCDRILCENGQILTDALRGSYESTVSGVNSVLKQLAEGTQSPGKKWVISAEYKIGDIISLNQVLYIAKKDNTGKSPAIYRTHWGVFKLPYSQNQGKVKAYCIFKTDGTIIKSMNFASVTEYSNSRFNFNFTDNITPHPVVAAAFVETSLDEDLILSVIKSETNRIQTQIVGVNIDQTSLITNISDNDDRIITFICYSTSNVL